MKRSLPLTRLASIATACAVVTVAELSAQQPRLGRPLPPAPRAATANAAAAIPTPPPRDTGLAGYDTTAAEPEPEPQADIGTPADPAIAGFLGTALGGLSENDVVKNACKSASQLTKYTQALSGAQGGMKSWGDFSSSFSARGVPVGDLGANMAATGYAKAVEMGAKSEAYSLGSLCNTSETSRLAQEQYDFLRHVVNRGIENPMPSIMASLDATEQAVSAVPMEQRLTRFDRIFGRTKRRGYVPDADIAVAAVDSTTAEAYQMRADSAAGVTLVELRRFAGELQQRADTTSPGCRAVAGTGDAGADAATTAATGAGTRCGALSPGRAEQISASALYLNATQLALTNQLVARRMDVEGVRAQAELRRDFLRDVARRHAPTP
jgi:hypothetical protein